MDKMWDNMTDDELRGEYENGCVFFLGEDRDPDGFPEEWAYFVELEKYLIKRLLVHP